jgi:Rieske Fe-S protein
VTRANCLLGVLLACFSAATQADDFPRGLIRKQVEQASQKIVVSLAELAPGQFRSVEYVGRPVYVYRRTPADLAHLADKSDDDLLADPESANADESVRAAYASSASQVWARLLLVDQLSLEKRRSRSLEQEILVVAGWSPHSGCALNLLPPMRRPREWAVFGDTCLDASFDSAGRILKGELGGIAGKRGTAFNLYIPPHYFKSPDKLVIGLAPRKRLPKLAFSHAALYEDKNPAHNLIIAARYNDRRMVGEALAAGANVNAYRPEEGSALDAAIIGSSIDVVKLLLARGAQPTPKSRKAADFVGRPEVIQLLGPSKD